MGLKEFTRRNRGPIAQMIVAAILIIGGVAMFEMSARNYQVPEFTPQQNSSKVATPPAVNGDQLMNCTPLFNATRKVSYSYRIYSNTPDGVIKMYVSYDYVGEDTVLGQRADVVEMRANSTAKNMTFDPIMKLWLDYSTSKCLKGELNVGKGYIYPISCADASFGLPVVTCEEQLAGLNYSAMQEVEVPFGKFNTSRYDKGKDSLWIAQGIPVPVKFVFEQMGNTAVAELERYSEKR